MLDAGGLLLQCELALLWTSICTLFLYLITHHLPHNLREGLCSQWTYQHGTLLTLLFKALCIHFEYHWHLASYVSHFSVIIIALFHTFSSVLASCWISATAVAVASVVFVASVANHIRFSVVASLKLTLLMRSNNVNVEHLLINLYEFTSRIKLFTIHSKQHLHHNN